MRVSDIREASVIQEPILIEKNDDWYKVTVGDNHEQYSDGVVCVELADVIMAATGFFDCDVPYKTDIGIVHVRRTGEEEWFTFEDFKSEYGQFDIRSIKDVLDVKEVTP